MKKQLIRLSKKICKFKSASQLLNNKKMYEVYNKIECLRLWEAYNSKSKPKRSQSSIHQQLYNQETINKYMVAVVVRAIIQGYKFTAEMYLFGLLLIQKLDILSDQLSEKAIYQISVAVIRILIRTFGDGVVIPDSHFVQHFPSISLQQVNQYYQCIKLACKGISISAIVKQQDPESVIFKIQKIIKHQIQKIAINSGSLHLCINQNNTQAKSSYSFINICPKSCSALLHV